ncbi:MAG: nucleoside deaminase [Bacteroidales bacterium]|nr:nucleoside deaminase [Bacteroidales bacterium]
MTAQDEHFMRLALEEAELAAEEDEVPVGAVVVMEGQVLGRGHNQTETLRDVTAHAEMIALTAAANHLGSKYLPGCTLYVTLEPCDMCAGAIGLSQISRVVFGVADPKRGFMRHENAQILHKKVIVEQGLLADECSRLLKEFFAQKR